MPIIYLLPTSLRGCICLPSEQCEQHCVPTEAETSRFIWHFNPQGLSASRIAAKRRALLPHIFTLIPPRGLGVGTVIFCDTLCLLICIKIPSVRWCGCSTLSGLSSLPIARYRDRLVGNSGAKIQIYC